MRFLLCVFAAFAALASVPASAQNLSDLLGIGRSATNGLNSFRYNGCAYEPGVFRTVCQAQRAVETVDRANQLRRQYDQARRRSATSVDLRDPDPATIARLQTLCSDGDDDACRIIRRMRADGTSARVETRRASMTPQMQRAEDAYERALAAQRSGGFAPIADASSAATTTAAAGNGRYRTAPDYTRR